MPLTVAVVAAGLSSVEQGGQDDSSQHQEPCGVSRVERVRGRGRYIYIHIYIERKRERERERKKRERERERQREMKTQRRIDETKFLDFFFDGAFATKNQEESRFFRYGCLIVLYCIIHPYVFLPLLKESSYNPYLKFLDFSQLLVADTPMTFFSRKILFAPCDSTFVTPSTKIFFLFLLKSKKSFYKTQLK